MMRKICRPCSISAALPDRSKSPPRSPSSVCRSISKPPPYFPPCLRVKTPGEMLAPTDEAAFNDLFVGKRATTNFPAVYVDFVSPGRFRETRFAVTLTGSYTYRNTGSDAGTLTFNYDDGDRCTTHLTFVSTMAGTATFTCNDGSSGGYNWLLVAISATGTPDLVVPDSFGKR